jgi:hypothetical protein
MVHLALFCEDYAPTTLGFGTPHGSSGGGISVSTTIAVGNLVKAIFRRYWSNLHWLKQNIVSWVSH